MRSSAPTWTWVVMGLILALAPAPATWAAGDSPGSAHNPKPRNAHVALTQGREASRRGDYEVAAAYLNYAQANQQTLTPQEVQDLGAWISQNSEAMSRRQVGVAQLAQAEDLAKAGRREEAGTLLKDVQVNQYLTQADKQRARHLSESLRTGTVTAKTTDSTIPVAAGQVSPKSSAKDKLFAARVALGRGDLDTAEQLAREAERNSSFWPHLWGDSPGKVLKEVHAKRAQALAQNHGMTMPANPSEAARHLVYQGRQALQQNDLDKARELATEAAALKPTLNWNEDNPDRLLGDIKKLEQNRVQTAVAKTVTQDSKQEIKPDPRDLLKQGRGFLAAGKLDEARDRAYKAQASDFSWGWLSDNPKKLLDDIQKAQEKRNKEQAEIELSEGRRLLQQGDLEGARAKAYKAQKLHGPYFIYSLSDRPDKLLADIEEASKKQRLKSAGAPGLNMPKNPQAPESMHPAANTQPAAGSPVPGGTNKMESRPLPNMRDSAYHGTPSEAGPTAPAAGASTAPGAAPATGSKAGEAVPDQDSARQMLAEARSQLKQGQLIVARAFAVEAKKNKAAFGKHDDNPDHVLAECDKAAEHQIRALMQTARADAAKMKSDPGAAGRVDTALNQARELAVNFGYDTSAIDKQASQIHQAPMPSR